MLESSCDIVKLSSGVKWSLGRPQGTLWKSIQIAQLWLKANDRVVIGFPCPLYQTVVSGFTVGREGVCRLCNVGISCVFLHKKHVRTMYWIKSFHFFFFNELKVTVEAPYMYFSLIFIGEILWLLVLRLLSPIWHNIFD